jgi:hypothetical protein
LLLVDVKTFNIFILSSLVWNHCSWKSFSFSEFALLLFLLRVEIATATVDEEKFTVNAFNEKNVSWDFFKPRIDLQSTIAR